MKVLNNIFFLINLINKLLNKTDEKNVETKIDQIEKEYQSKLKEIEPLANIQIKEKNIIIILPTFDSLRLNKEIINKELTPLCNNIGYTTQLTNN